MRRLWRCLGLYEPRIGADDADADFVVAHLFDTLIEAVRATTISVFFDAKTNSAA